MATGPLNQHDAHLRWMLTHRMSEVAPRERQQVEKCLSDAGYAAVKATRGEVQAAAVSIISGCKRLDLVCVGDLAQYQEGIAAERAMIRKSVQFLETAQIFVNTMQEVLHAAADQRASKKWAMNKAEYNQLVMRVSAVLDPKMDQDKVLEMASQDWKVDGVPKGMHAVLLADYLFNIADAWCEVVSEPVYCAFVMLLLDKICEMPQSHSSVFPPPPRWRRVEDITPISNDDMAAVLLSTEQPARRNSKDTEYTTEEADPLGPALAQGEPSPEPAPARRVRRPKPERRRHYEAPTWYQALADQHNRYVALLPKESDMLMASCLKVSSASSTGPQVTPAATVCECGNEFMDDSLFCRKCGTERPVEGDIRMEAALRQQANAMLLDAEQVVQVMQEQLQRKLSNQEAGALCEMLGLTRGFHKVRADEFMLQMFGTDKF